MRHLTLGLAALLLGAFAAGCSTDDGGGGDDGGGSVELTIESFLANPSKVAPGEESILSWKTKNATSIRIFDAKNDRIGQGTENEGSVTVTLTETTTFRLQAQNSSGASKEATVQVVVQEEVGPTLSFSANQTNVDFESSTFLRWDTTGAVRVVVAEANGGEVLVDTDRDADKTKLSGDREITPTRTTVYEATATDEDGQTTTAAVEVIVDPVVTTFGSPTLTHPIPIGTEVTLNWITRGAEAIEITTPEGESYTVPETALAAGETTMIAGESGIFTLKATRGKGEKVRELKAQMREFPTVDLFEVTPDAINAGQPTPLTISWKVSNADTIQIAAEGGAVIVPTTTELEGSKDFTASSATTFTITAVNLAGETTEDITVRAVARPEIVSFMATPNRVTPFGTTRLAWSTTNATILTLEQTDDLGEVTQHTIPQGDEGTIDVNLSTRSTFTLVAKNDAGASVDASATVEIGPPAVDSFTTSKARFDSGEPIVLSWIGRGGRSAKVFSIERNGDGDPINPVLECEVTFPATSSSGTCTAPAQTTLGRYEFQLLLEDGSFSDTAFVTALVSDGPVIERFLASPAQIDEGDSTTLSWTVQNDAAGNTPELILTIDGVEQDVQEMVDNPQNGTATLDFPNAGRYRLELSATSDGGTTYTDKATIIVTVVGMPSIDSFTATPDTVEDNLPVTLAWTMTNVSQAAIHDAATNNLLFSIPTGRLATGSHQLAPTGVTSITYRLIAYNLNNEKVQDDVTVTVTPPTAQIVSFSAPATANAGDVITLDWNTRGGTDVILTPILGAATLLSNAPFEDISATGTALAMVDCGSSWRGPLEDGCATVNFSNGFTFPFDGQKRTALDVYVDGFISFDVGADLAGDDPVNFPNDPGINLAPFWDVLTTAAGGVAPAGAVYYQQKSGPNGDYLVVQWSHVRNDPAMTFWLSPTDAVDLNFQVILWANGAVDFRYGTMVSAVGLEDEANGSHAVIGYQDTDAGFVDMLSPLGMIVPGGLDGRSWGYLEQSQLATDTMQLTVDKTTIFTLCLETPAGRICQERTVTVN